MNYHDLKKFALPLILALSFFIYANALFNDFVWDDEEQVVYNTVIRDLRNLPLIFTSSTFYAGGAGLSGGFYRPLVTLSYFINYRLWGLEPAGYRLMQILIHAANIALLYYLLKKILSDNQALYSDYIAAFCALCFAIHPASVESVVYVGCIGEVVYAFFILLAMLAFAKGADYQSHAINFKALAAFFALVFFGLLAKETAIVALPITFFYLWLFIKPRFSVYAKFFAGTAIISGFYAFLRFFIAKLPVASAHFAPIAQASLLERLMTVPYEIVSYLGIIFFPHILSISRHFVIHSAADPRFWASLVFLAILSIAAVFYTYKTKAKLLAFFLLWFVAGLAPTLNILPLDMTIAERWLYVPIIGIIAAIILAVAPLVAALSKSQKTAAYVALAIVVCLFSVRTVARNENWKNGLSLYSHDAGLISQVSPQGSFDLENNVGVELFRAGKIEEAGEHFERSIVLQPKWALSQNNLGAVLERQGDLEGALDKYRKAVEFGDYYLAYENIGNILIKTKQYDQAKLFLEQSLQKFPQNINMQLELAYLYAADNIGNDKNAKLKAVYLLSQVLAQDPQNQKALQLYWLMQNNQGITL
jgi:tetratricopeptide (TPR) repeat protein